MHRSPGSPPEADDEQRRRQAELRTLFNGYDLDRTSFLESSALTQRGEPADGPPG